jgi:plasmid stabilization system protein ParE
VTRVELTELARQDLDSLIRTRELPVSTHDRVERVVEQLRSFPLSGQLVGGRYPASRSISVAWGWLVLHYVYDEEADRVYIIGVVDGRTRSAPHP